MSRMQPIEIRNKRQHIQLIQSDLKHTVFTLYNQHYHQASENNLSFESRMASSSFIALSCNRAAIFTAFSSVKNQPQEYSEAVAPEVQANLTFWPPFLSFDFGFSS